MRQLLFLLTFGLIGTGILITLGVWQVQRLGWKQGLLAQIDAQVAAEAVPLDNASDVQIDRYAPVSVTGQFGENHIRVLASRKSVGAVYRIIRPFFVDRGDAILIDTGWQPEDAIVLEAPSENLTLTGNIDAPNEADQFTPEPDIDANIWFARDVPAMARTLGTQPVLIVLRDTPELDIGVTPWPVDIAGIPNDHLQYAITWFSLAVIWAGMTAFFLWRMPRYAAKKD